MRNEKISEQTPYAVLTVKLSFLTEVLGTASANPDLHSEFIASKAPDAISCEEEIEAIGVDAYEEKQMTIFPKLPDGTPILWSYQVRGFLKESCAMLQRAGNKAASPATMGIKAYKKTIDGNIFVSPRQIPIDLKGEEIGTLERPLRAQTAQGERVALAKSEVVPAGSEITFSLCDIGGGKYIKAVKEWLDYGLFHGLGQWRNSDKGSFTYEILDEYFIDRKEFADTYCIA